MDYAELAPQLQTADIFLFNGTTAVSAIIDEITHSPFSHIGMVYRTPGSSGADGLRLWQSFEPEGGVVDDELRPFLVKYQATEAGSSFAARQLVVTRTPAMLAAAEAFMAKVKGAKFPDTLPWIRNYLAACLGVANTDGTYDCSQYVAESYMAMGLLKTWPLGAVYTPGRFAVEAYELQLQLGAVFGDQLPVTLTA